MKISLNVDNFNAVFFYLPISKIHLSIDHPGPIEVNETLLDSKELEQVRKASLTNILLVEDLQKDFVVQEKPKVFVIKDLETNRMLIIENAKKSLSHPLPALIKSIDSNADITHLKAMRDWEKNNKNRKKVLSALDKKIDSISKSLSLSIGADLDDSAFFKEARIPEIEYTDEETITINLGDEE